MLAHTITEATRPELLERLIGRTLTKVDVRDDATVLFFGDGHRLDVEAPGVRGRVELDA